MRDRRSLSPRMSYSPETAIPPPPPGIYSPLVSQPKRNTGYQVALAVLTVLVVALGSLEVIQLAAHTPLTTYPSGSTGSKQAGITSAQRAMTPHKTVPVLTLTPGTIKENRRLTCSGCDDPVLTTINSITIDTTISEQSGQLPYTTRAELNKSIISSSSAFKISWAIRIREQAVSIPTSF